MTLMLAHGYNAVVANVAPAGYACVVITTICCQFQKTSGIVTVITFGTGCRVFVGFADGPYTVMAFTAFTKNF
jgi:hypothetical protein